MCLRVTPGWNWWNHRRSCVAPLGIPTFPGCRKQQWEKSQSRPFHPAATQHESGLDHTINARIPVRSVWNISFDLPVITLGLNQNKFIYLYNNNDNNNDNINKNNNIIYTYIHQHQLPTCETNGLKDGASTSLSAPSNPKKGWNVPLQDINSSQVWRRHPWSYSDLSSSVLRCRQMKLPMDLFMFAFVCICTCVSISWR